MLGAADLATVIGNRHLDDGALVLFDQVIRRFLGPDRTPAWIETTGAVPTGKTRLEAMTAPLVRTGAEMPALAVRETELRTPNPPPPEIHQVVGFPDLPALMGVAPPEITADAVQQILRTQLAIGDMSEDRVASRLAIGLAPNAYRSVSRRA